MCRDCAYHEAGSTVLWCVEKHGFSAKPLSRKGENCFTVPNLFEELRKLRVAQLRRELQHYDNSIGYAILVHTCDFWLPRLILLTVCIIGLVYCVALPSCEFRYFNV